MNKPNTTPTGPQPEEQHEGRGQDDELTELLDSIKAEPWNWDDTHVKLAAEIRRLRQASRANVEEELASVLLDTQEQLEEARASEVLVADLFEAAEWGYGWICNFPTTNPDLARAQAGVSKQIGDLLYSEPRLEALRAANRTRLMANEEPQPTVAQATAPETEGGRE